MAKNHAHVKREKNALRLVGRIPAREEEESAVLVVTNKPIPMEVLVNIATRQEFHGETFKDAVHVYYFEVTIQKGITWVGLVPSRELQGPVTLGRFPGDCMSSIGMSSDGRLYVSGQQEQEGVSVNNTNPSVFTERDTIGCGLEVGEEAVARVFFTKNGEMLLAPMTVTELNPHADWYFPAVGVAAAGGDVFANFGISYPFRWKGSEHHVLFSPSEVVAAPPDSPLRRAATTTGVPFQRETVAHSSPLKPPPGGANVSSVGAPPGSQPRCPSVAERIDEMRRLQQQSNLAGESAPMPVSGQIPSLPLANAITGAGARSMPDWERHVPEGPRDENEMNAKLPPVPQQRNMHGGSLSASHGSTLHSSYGSSFSSSGILHQSQESFGEGRQPRQSDDLHGNAVKLPSRPSAESLKAESLSAGRTHTPHSSSTSSSRPSLSSSGLYGRPSDRSIRLDEPFPDEDSTPQFLSSPGFARKAQGADEYAGRVGAHYVPEPASGRVGTAALMDPQDIEDANHCARDLRECCESNNASFAHDLLELCRSKQAMIVKTMQEGMIKIDDPAMEAPLNELMILNDTLLDAIEIAERQLENKPVSPVPPVLDSGPDSRPSVPFPTATGSLEIDVLVNRQDVFSLICMLRARGDKRLDSALALMRCA